MSKDPKVVALLRLPWTIVQERLPGGEILFRVVEIPAAVGEGATAQEAEADLWEALAEALAALIHFGDPVPMPAGGPPPWLKQASGVVRPSGKFTVRDSSTAGLGVFLEAAPA